MRLISRLQRLLSTSPARGGPSAAIPDAEDLPPVAPFTRADWAALLWEDGYLLPGGEAAVMRLAGLLPLSSATTLLLPGQDAGGAAAAIADRRGTWISAYQHEPALLADTAARAGRIGKRITVAAWDPAAPAFRVGFHHHALALEACRSGAVPAALAAAMAKALKPGAQLVLLEVVRAETTQAHPSLDRWRLLEGRPWLPPTEQAMELALRSAGFATHVVEDTGAAHRGAISTAWSGLLRALAEGPRPPGRDSIISLIEEAEAWMYRQRLLQLGALRLLRWHATLRR